MTQRMASTILDLPQPFGPTIATKLLFSGIVVGSTKDLKPDSLMDSNRIPTLSCSIDKQSGHFSLNRGGDKAEIDLYVRYNAGMGWHYFLLGIQRLTAPGLKRYVWPPFLINVVVFGALFATIIVWLRGWLARLDHWLPTWLHWLEWLIWPLLVITLLVALTYAFTLIATIISAPFNTLLAEKVIEQSGRHPVIDTSWHDFLKEIPRSLRREWRKLVYYIPLLLICLIVIFIPVIQVFSGIIWVLLSMWMLAIQYLDYAFESRRIDFPTALKRLRSKRLHTLGFGAMVMLASIIPVLNFLVIPAAVIGGTQLVIDQDLL